MNTPRLTDEQLADLKRWHSAIVEHQQRNPPGTLGPTGRAEAMLVALDELEWLRAALAERDWLLASVLRDDVTGAGEAGAAREREAIAEEVILVAKRTEAKAPEQGAEQLGAAIAALIRLAIEIQ